MQSIGVCCFDRDATLKSSHKNITEKYKHRFARQQSSKCAFCETDVRSHHAHIDHFAPRSEEWVRSDDPEDWPQEKHDSGVLPNATRPRNYQVRKPGYWWLAFDWSNYLLVCWICNSNYKLCFFPVNTTRTGDTPPDRTRPEQRLLLNPFDDSAPWRQFVFNERGVIVNYEARGYETMVTCGLDRPSLLRTRTSIAQRATRFARRAARGDRTWLRELYDLGRDDAPHAGMVRAIAEDILGAEHPGLQWQHLVALHRPHSPQPT